MMEISVTTLLFKTFISYSKLTEFISLNLSQKVPWPKHVECRE